MTVKVLIEGGKECASSGFNVAIGQFQNTTGTGMSNPHPPKQAIIAGNVPAAEVKPKGESA